MKKNLLFAIIALSINAFAQTSIPGGNVSGTWTLAGSPYNVQGSIMIPNDSTLIIDPGVIVNFQGDYKLYVQGRVIAIGNIANTISFISADTVIGWRGIQFDNTPSSNDSSKFIYCINKWTNTNGFGAFYINSFSKALIDHCLIENSQKDGILCVSSSSPNTSINPIISNNTISNNAYGGIFCDWGGNPSISNNTISNNSSNGIFCGSSSSPTISNNTISNNSFAGIYCTETNPETDPFSWCSGLTGPDHMLCALNGFGLPGSPTIFNNTISNNTYGGIYSKTSTSGGASISNNIIISNTNSGGIYCDGNYNDTISNNTISNNSIGGIYCAPGSSPLISYNIIANNTGSGIATQGNCTISNNIIANNSNSGIGCNGASPIINNTTIVNNNDSISGGALYCMQSSSPTLRNCILYGNTSTNGAQVFLDDESSDPNFYYCDVQGGSTDFGLNGNFYIGTYQNNINVNPLFVSPSGGSGTGFNGVTANWALGCNSPCINAGDSTGIYPATDIAGNQRVIGGRIDIGSYEFTLFPTITAGGATTFCQGGNITLTASSATSYLWSNSATTQSITVSTSGNYSVTVTDINGCSATSTPTTVTVNPLPTTPTITAGGATTFCQDGNVTLTASSATSYLWSNSATTQTITVSASGNYSVTTTDGNGCSATSTPTTVTVNPLPTTPTITATGTTLTSSSSTGNQWYFNGNIINGATSQTYTVTQNGNYTVVVTDSNGCSATSAQFNFTNVSIEDLTINNSIIVIPNPSNGIFHIETKNLQFSKIKIFNTLGEIIYESMSRNLEIDLSTQPKGTYFIEVDTQDKTYNKKLIIE